MSKRFSGNMFRQFCCSFQYHIFDYTLCYSIFLIHFEGWNLSEGRNRSDGRNCFDGCNRFGGRNHFEGRNMGPS